MKIRKIGHYPRKHYEECYNYDRGIDVDDAPPYVVDAIVAWCEKRKAGWISGSAGIFVFQAKIYEEPSKYGIGAGRVSKLQIKRPIDVPTT